jgi:hypothetical protein
MHKGLPQFFGERPLLIIAHGGVLAVYLCFRVMLFLKWRKQTLQVTTDSL